MYPMGVANVRWLCDLLVDKISSYKQAWASEGLFPGGGQKDFFHGKPKLVAFRFTHSKLRDNLLILKFY